MSIATPPRPSSSKVRRAKLPESKPSAYEQVASVLISSTLILGSLVFCLLLIWLGLKVLAPPLPVAVEYEELGGGTPDGVAGESLKLDGPLDEQVAQETNDQQQALEQLIEHVESAVSERKAELDDPLITEEIVTTGKKAGSDGTGNRRNKGLGPGDKGGVAAELRWVIEFDESNSLDEYARQLDYFKIELGVVGNSNEINYASLLAGTPTIRKGPGEQEKRLFFSWKSGTRQEADRKLLAKGGIQAAGKTVVHFYSDDLKKLIYATEHAHLKKMQPTKQMRDIWRTRFVIQKQGAGYEFVVVDQTYF